jgi:hypothetical protein
VINGCLFFANLSCFSITSPYIGLNESLAEKAIEMLLHTPESVSA